MVHWKWNTASNIGVWTFSSEVARCPPQRPAKFFTIWCQLTCPAYLLLRLVYTPSSPLPSFAVPQTCLLYAHIHKHIYICQRQFFLIHSNSYSSSVYLFWHHLLPEASLALSLWISSYSPAFHHFIDIKVKPSFKPISASLTLSAKDLDSENLDK